ncbi:MAG TPA: response regulator transcription factor, partial [Tepidiformaceae bacterium]|nr:response regulator transcription factor [Tepidiformaceae bacterium]
MSGARVLVVDDDPSILKLVRRSLEAAGYRVEGVADGGRAVAKVQEFRPEVVLLDLVLPNEDGVEICRRLRQTGSGVPIIVLSAVGDEQRKIEALDAGADDYVTKPFSIEELKARVRVALRRHAGQAADTVVEAGPIRIDLVGHAVTAGGVAVHLTPREFELCRLLVTNQGRVLTQRQLLTAVWG